MNVRWQDWVVITLGCWLTVSPWGIAYSLNKGATINSLVLGVVLVLFNLIFVCRLKDEGQEVFNIMLGIWLIFSPYTLNLLTDKVPMLNAIAIGSVNITIALWEIYAAGKLEK